MNCNINGKMSLNFGIFPASIGKNFFALGTIPETGVGFIGRKITVFIWFLGTDWPRIYTDGDLFENHVV